MKTKILFLLILFAGSLSAQIPNNGFEQWENYPDYAEECQPSPEVYLKPVDWVGALPRDCRRSYSVIQVNESYPAGTGNYAMKVASDIENTTPGLATSFDQWHHWPFPPAFPVGYRPTKLCLYYKNQPVEGDSAVINCIFFKNSTEIGRASFITKEAHSEWTALEINAVYDNNETPDSACIMISTFVSMQHQGSNITVDNLNFDTFIAGLDQPKQSGVKLWPNPTSDKLHIYSNTGTGSVSIFDTCGQVTLKEIINNEKTIDISNLKPGVYFLKYNDEVLRFIKK